MPPKPSDLDFAISATPVQPICGEHVTLVMTVNHPNEEAVQVEKLFFTLTIGGAAAELTPTFAGISPKPPAGWTFEHSADGSFVAKPIGEKHGLITGGGLQFSLAHIAVNNEPGVATVQFASKTKDDGWSMASVAEIHKIEPPVTLSAHLDDLFVPYGDEAVINWHASRGSTVVLGFRGTEYRTVAGDKNKSPLPVKGSFKIENITDTLPIVVTATGVGPSGSETQTRQISVGVAAPRIESFEIIGPRDKPAARLKWVGTGATVGTITSNEGETWTLKGSGEMKAISNSAEKKFTLTLSNPKFPKPLTQQKDNPKVVVKTLGTFGWERVYPFLYHVENPQIVTGLDHLVIHPTAGDAQNKLTIYACTDCLNWQRYDVPGVFPHDSRISTFEYEGYFYVVTRQGNLRIDYTNDFKNWQTMRAGEPSQPDLLAGTSGPLASRVAFFTTITCDPDGKLWAWDNCMRAPSTAQLTSPATIGPWSKVKPTRESERYQYLAPPCHWNGLHYFWHGGGIDAIKSTGLTDGGEWYPAYSEVAVFFSRRRDATYVGGSNDERYKDQYQFAQFKDSLRLTYWHPDREPTDISILPDGNFTENGKAVDWLTSSIMDPAFLKTEKVQGLFPVSQAAYKGALYSVGKNLASKPDDPDHNEIWICMRNT